MSEPSVSSEPTVSSIEELPAELQVAILRHLPCPEGLLGIARTSVGFHEAANDSSLWCAVRLSMSACRSEAWTAERAARLVRQHPAITELNCLGLRCVSDETVARIFHSGPPALQALRLPQCTKLTDAGAAALALAPHPCVCELVLTDCHRLTDTGVETLVLAHTNRLRSLNLAGLHRCTDAALEAVASACPHLTSLDLSGCDKVTDVGIGQLAACTELRQLNLAGLDLVTDVAPLAGLSLDDLNVADCLELGDDSLEKLLHGTSCLTALSIAGLPELGASGDVLRALSSGSGGSITGLSAAGCVGIPASTWGTLELPALRILSVAGCAIDDDGISHMSASSPALTALNLRSCSRLTSSGLLAAASCLCGLTELNVAKLGKALSDEALVAFAAGCPALRKLNATGSDAIGATIGFAALTAVARLHELRELSLAGCASVGDECLLALGGGSCTGLEECDLSGCIRCSDSGLRALSAGCPRLRALFVMGLTRISDVGVRHVARSCPGLTSLSFMGCSGLTDEALPWLSKLPDLRLLNLGSCAKLGALGLRLLGHGCPMLQSLDISNCVLVDASELQALCDRCHLLHSLNVQGLPPAVLSSVTWKGWAGRH